MIDYTFMGASDFENLIMTFLYNWKNETDGQFKYKYTEDFVKMMGEDCCGGVISAVDSLRDEGLIKIKPEPHSGKPFKIKLLPAGAVKVELMKNASIEILSSRVLFTLSEWSQKVVIPLPVKFACYANGVYFEGTITKIGNYLDSKGLIEKSKRLFGQVIKANVSKAGMMKARGLD